MLTPKKSKLLKELNENDQAQIKTGLNRYGNTVFKPLKTGINHLFDSPLYDATVYYCRSNGIINSGDTFTDSESNIFSVSLIDAAIPANERCKIQIIGSTALVNTDINY